MGPAGSGLEMGIGACYSSGLVGKEGERDRGSGHQQLQGRGERIGTCYNSGEGEREKGSRCATSGEEKSKRGSRCAAGPERGEGRGRERNAALERIPKLNKWASVSRS